MLRMIFIAYTLLVIGLSLIPTAMAGGGMHSDKFAHFIAYGAMGFLAYISVRSINKRVSFDAISGSLLGWIVLKSDLRKLLSDA